MGLSRVEHVDAEGALGKGSEVGDTVLASESCQIQVVFAFNDFRKRRQMDDRNSFPAISVYDILQSSQISNHLRVSEPLRHVRRA